MAYIHRIARGGNTAETTMASALVELRSADHDDLGALAAAVDAAARALEEAVTERKSYSKTEAARLLGLSPQALGLWISRGLVPTRRFPDYERKRIPAEPLLALATEVAELRRMGRKRGLLAEALVRLEAEGADGWVKEIEPVVKQAKKPLNRGDYVSAAPWARLGRGRLT